jgi:hypothetical protein
MNDGRQSNTCKNADGKPQILKFIGFAPRLPEDACED